RVHPLAPLPARATRKGEPRLLDPDAGADGAGKDTNAVLVSPALARCPVASGGLYWAVLLGSHYRRNPPQMARRARGAKGPAHPDDACRGAGSFHVPHLVYPAHLRRARGARLSWRLLPAAGGGPLANADQAVGCGCHGRRPGRRRSRPWLPVRLRV